MGSNCRLITVTVTISVGSLLLGGLLQLLPLACLLEGLGLGVRCVRLDAGVRLVPVTVAVHHRAVPARRGGGGGPRLGGGAASGGGGGRGGAGGGGDRSGGGGGHRWRLLLLLLLWQGRDSGPRHRQQSVQQARHARLVEVLVHPEHNM